MHDLYYDIITEMRKLILFVDMRKLFLLYFPFKDTKTIDYGIIFLLVISGNNKNIYGHMNSIGGNYVWHPQNKVKS